MKVLKKSAEKSFTIKFGTRKRKRNEKDANGKGSRKKEPGSWRKSGV